jgi:hypothetical protein
LEPRADKPECKFLNAFEFLKPWEDGCQNSAGEYLRMPEISRIEKPSDLMLPHGNYKVGRKVFERRHFYTQTTQL